MTDFSVLPLQLGNASGAEPLGQRVNAFLVGDRTLVNAGHPSQIETLKAQLRANGVEPQNIERIVCTSWAIDVVGGARHFPKADVFVVSPDGVAPHVYSEFVEAEKLRTLPYLSFAKADAESFFGRWFDGAPHRLEFVPLMLGASVALDGVVFDTHALHGFDPGAALFHSADEHVLFASELVLSGTPGQVRDPQGFLGDLDRAANLGAMAVFCNHGGYSLRGADDLRRATRWANNLLSNAQHAMRGGATLAEFVERDLGYIPDDPVEFALRLQAMHPFLEELVQSHVIDAVGSGFDRRYGTNVEVRL